MVTMALTPCRCTCLHIFELIEKAVHLLVHLVVFSLTFYLYLPINPCDILCYLFTFLKSKLHSSSVNYLSWPFPSPRHSSIDGNITAFGRKLTLYSAIPLSRFSLKMCRFFGVFRVGKNALYALCSASTRQPASSARQS